MSAKKKDATKINTLEEIHGASLMKRSLMYSGWARPVPASIVISMQGTMILRYIRKGLFLYEPKPKVDFFAKKRKEGA
jgi:hypothetical protein